MVGFREGQLTTRTGPDGSYTVSSFSTSQPYADSQPNVLALVVVWFTAPWELGSGYETMVQEIPRGANQIVQNVRLRPRRRAIMAGESRLLFLDPDSSLPFDWEYSPWELGPYGRFAVRFDRNWEWFYVSAAREGVLTVDVRPETNGSVPYLWCDLVGCPGPNAQGPISVAVGGFGPIVFRAEIPRAWAPQRYVITTSLQ